MHAQPTGQPFESEGLRYTTWEMNESIPPFTTPFDDFDASQTGAKSRDSNVRPPSEEEQKPFSWLSFDAEQVEGLMDDERSYDLWAMSATNEAEAVAPRGNGEADYTYQSQGDKDKDYPYQAESDYDYALYGDSSDTYGDDYEEE